MTGWTILAPKLVEGDARIATLMLRSDILDALKRYKEAHEASLLAFEATVWVRVQYPYQVLVDVTCCVYTPAAIVCGVRRGDENLYG